MELDTQISLGLNLSVIKSELCGLQNSLVQWFSKCVLWPSPSGTLKDADILGSTPDLLNQKLRERGQQSFISPAGDSDVGETLVQSNILTYVFL